jgi:hypothetical protein
MVSRKLAKVVEIFVEIGHNVSVATVRTGVLANLSNKIAKIIGKFENVDEAKNQGVFCQH